MKQRLTGLSNADSDVTAHERGLCEGEGLLQAVNCGELDVAEALGLVVELVLNNANVGDLTSAEEGLNVGLGDIEGEVSEVSSVRGLVGHGKLLASGERTVCHELAWSQHGSRGVYSLTEASNTLSAGSATDAASSTLPRRGGHGPSLFPVASASLSVPSTVSRAGCGQRLCVHLVGP